jgi:L-ascorbate metabolism protein UlaG (beta-lactamase superfamily)
MTPEQAVAAGIVLGAGAVCPIHYGLDVPLYREYPQAPECFASWAQKRGLPVLWLQPGEEVSWEQI